MDENLAAFQAQITQLQGEYPLPRVTFLLRFETCFVASFAYLCITFVALSYDSFCGFQPLFTRCIVARYPATALGIIHSPEVTNRRNAPKGYTHPPTLN